MAKKRNPAPFMTALISGAGMTAGSRLASGLFADERARNPKPAKHKDAVTPDELRRQQSAHRLHSLRAHGSPTRADYTHGGQVIYCMEPGCNWRRSIQPARNPKGGAMTPNPLTRDELRREAARLGIYIATWSPGDGVTRYRFMTTDKDYFEASASETLVTVRGLAAARRWLAKFERGAAPHPYLRGKTIGPGYRGNPFDIGEAVRVPALDSTGVIKAQVRKAGLLGGRTTYEVELEDPVGRQKSVIVPKSGIQRLNPLGRRRGGRAVLGPYYSRRDAEVALHDYNAAWPSASESRWIVLRRSDPLYGRSWWVYNSTPERRGLNPRPKGAQRLYGVYWPGGKTGRFGLTTNKQEAVKLARERSGWVGWVTYTGSPSSWDWPTFYVSATPLADFRKTASNPAPAHTSEPCPGCGHRVNPPKSRRPFRCRHCHSLLGQGVSNPVGHRARPFKVTGVIRAEALGLPPKPFNFRTMISDTTRIVTLTTDHARSSYGQPVLVYRGRIFGPGDLRGPDRRIHIGYSKLSDAELLSLRDAGWDVVRTEGA